MPRQGITAYDLLISCPGDINKYADIIKECLEGFNTIIGRINNAEIVGRHWSTDSYAQSGDKPQELLNKQFVRDCDAAVAVLWTRFGTPTDKYGSGTEEEIEEMFSDGKQVFMYFIEEEVSLSNVDIEQYKKVQEFKEKYKNKGLYFTAKDEAEFRRLFTNHLSMHFLPIIVGEKNNVEACIPKLCIRDYVSGEEAIGHIQTDFQNSRFVENKEQMIHEMINLLKSSFLELREKKETATESLNDEEEETELQKALRKTVLLNNMSSAVEIPKDWKSTINLCANQLGETIPSRFWNVGNLKKSTINLSPILGGGIKLSGTDEEKDRYESIQKLYWQTRELNEYKSYFKQLDSLVLVRLVIANVGTSFDEDIDVKLFFEKGIIVKGDSIPIPGMNIIDELLELRFVEHSYKMKTTEMVDAYDGYPVELPKYNFRVNDPFNPKSYHEEYEESREKYVDKLNEIFCYNYYEKTDTDILTFHIKYLKHNRRMAFPSFLLFRQVPKKVSYEISSKHIPNVIQGELKIQE